ncbi:hypothetical protein T484DRAFT_1860345 [Baffinella frigidus]|nr:hypothetical protein T484DRAFT_1860345 [Cryptophyta sp. CCMP2293]
MLDRIAGYFPVTIEALPEGSEIAKMLDRNAGYFPVTIEALPEGYFPVTIEALPEGSVAYPHTPCFIITAEDDYSRLCTFLETILTMGWKLA